MDTSMPLICPPSSAAVEKSTPGLAETISEGTVIAKDELKNNNLPTLSVKAKSHKRVVWSSDTIDNEHLGRRSFKCCICKKPRAFGESSSESDKEDENTDDPLLCGSKQGRRHVRFNSASTASSQKLDDPSQSLPSPIKD
uniref:E3 ubiquitin-protein ligase PPP1R11-like n=1 Tax=Jaculus jaculus TaxID=51337 RepID=UPI001E1B2BC7|nr:E3 ubiquitin-protein ligase PPP1R11-like [Jaculus jaculus]XP_044995806.1 E3 ubiquitin-protein ligase PPP1R11-like [Jaculus jaculus]